MVYGAKDMTKVHVWTFILKTWIELIYLKIWCNAKQVQSSTNPGETKRAQNDLINCCISSTICLLSERRAKSMKCCCLRFMSPLFGAALAFVFHNEFVSVWKVLQEWRKFVGFFSSCLQWGVGSRSQFWGEQLSACTSLCGVGSTRSFADPLLWKPFWWILWFFLLQKKFFSLIFLSRLL